MRSIRLAHGVRPARPRKVEFFTSRLRVPLEARPRQAYAAYDERTSSSTRYFAQKLPIFVTGHPPVVHFVTLALDNSGDGFERFLRDHACLLSHVPSWAIDIVGPAESAAALAACRGVFDRYVLSQQTHSLPAAADDVSRHFAIRRSLEENEVTSVSIADLNWFRESRSRFADSIMEARFARRLVDGDRALAADTSASGRPDIGLGRFVAHSLPFTYQQFGDLAGVC